ncbi:MULTISPECIES: trimeric intracellular cation channel family protein [unclassified Janibacter]|uniref:trimeric intracellular cation channel family protein n=1 Tax=unclassified Janibacter TaxID=2649294 RepID=UPI003D08C5B9
MLPLNPTANLVLDLLGVFVFALSGGLVAIRRGLDLFGILVLSGAAGLGGGVVRDVLLGLTPPAGVSDWRLVTTTLVAGLLTFFFHPRMPRISRVVRVLDAVGLAAFACVGTLKAIDAGATGMAAVFVGSVTAFGGGIIRDLLAGTVPEVLRRELYAVPAILGASVLAIGEATGHLGQALVWLVFSLVFAVRMLAVVLDLHAPYARKPER